MKVFKVLGIIVLLLIILVSGALYYVFANIDGIVERAVESQGSALTTTQVELGGAEIDLLDGRAQLNEFTIANPDSFSSENLLEAEQLVFNIEPTSLRSDVIVINEVVISGVRVVAEQKALTTNIQTVLQAIKENLPEARKPADAEAGAELRFMVEHLRIADSQIKVITEKFGEKEFAIAPVEASHLGSKTSGLTASELAVAILEPYLQRAKEVAQQKLKVMAEDKLKGKAEAKLEEELGEDAEKALDKVKDLF